MKQILNRPFLLALLLSLPLWIVFGNYVVAIIAALLIAFLLSMTNSLFILKGGRHKDRADHSAKNVTGKKAE